MDNEILAAFEPQTVSVHLTDLLPLRQVTPQVLKSRKFLQILSSVREVGIIEPPTVVRDEGGTGKYYLVQGYLRVEALRMLEIPTVVCLVATDDEAYTYNKRVNRLAPIQEHRMILKAIDRGVSEKRIARALNVNVESIRRKRDLLHGICPEAVALLRDRQCPYQTFRCLKRMKPLRQIEAVGLMVDLNNFSVAYARSLLLATKRDQLVETSRPRSGSPQATEHMARLERELGNLRKAVEVIKDSYGSDHLKLVITRSHLEVLFQNDNVVRYLTKHHGEIFEELRKLVDTTNILSEAPDSAELAVA